MFHDDEIAYQSRVAQTELPEGSFKSLTDDYFSVGQDVSYYNNIVKNFDREGREEIFKLPPKEEMVL